jgi:hypothetical protein
MGKPIEISRDESSAAELRTLTSSIRDGRVVRRAPSRLQHSGKHWSPMTRSGGRMHG